MSGYMRKCAEHLNQLVAKCKQCDTPERAAEWLGENRIDLIQAAHALQEAFGLTSHQVRDYLAPYNSGRSDGQ